MDTEAQELIAAYALDALDADETARAEELLRTSAEAREELQAFSAAVEGLAVAASGPGPRPELRERILEDARAERQEVVPLESVQRRRVAVPVISAIAAVAAAIAIGLGIHAASLSHDLDSTRSALHQQQGVSAVLADPTARHVALSPGQGRLVVASSGDAVLVVDGLSAAPPGKTYQAWVVNGQTPRSAGTFAGAGTQTVVPLSGKVERNTVVAVTIEQAGGAPAPTSKPIVASAPV